MPEIGDHEYVVEPGWFQPDIALSLLHVHQLVFVHFDKHSVNKAEHCQDLIKVNRPGYELPLKVTSNLVHQLSGIKVRINNLDKMYCRHGGLDASYRESAAQDGPNGRLSPSFL